MRAVRMKFWPMSANCCSFSPGAERPSWRIGTDEALYSTMNGGVIPGGSVRTVLWLIAVTWAIANPMSVCGWKKTLTRPTPANDCDSICSMLLTVVVRERSKLNTTRLDISSGDSPVYCQTTVITGMSIFGKMSTGVRTIDTTPRIRIRIEATIKVYGRRNASRTIHMCSALQRFVYYDAWTTHPDSSKFSFVPLSHAGLKI